MIGHAFSYVHNTRFNSSYVSREIPNSYRNRTPNGMNQSLELIIGLYNFDATRTCTETYLDLYKFLFIQNI